MKTRCGLKVNSHDGDCDVFLEPPCCKFSPNVERLPEPVCGNTSAWCRARRGRSGGHDNAAPRSPALGSVIEREPQVLCLEPTTSSHHSSAPSGLLQPVPRDSWASQACSLPPSKGLLWGTRWARTRRPGTVRAVLHLLCCRCEKAAALLHRAQTPLWPEDFPWYLHPLLFFCFFLPHVHHKNLLRILSRLGVCVLKNLKQRNNYELQAGFCYFIVLLVNDQCYSNVGAYFQPLVNVETDWCLQISCHQGA